MAVRDDLVDAFTESVWQERQRQVEKFGDQVGEEMGLPFVADGAATIAFDGSAKYWQYKNPERFSEGRGSWDGVLLEEVYEALAETDAEKMEVELIQVAAVACAMYEASVRRREAAAKAAQESEEERRALERQRDHAILLDPAVEDRSESVRYFSNEFIQNEVAYRIPARNEFIQMTYEPDESGSAEGASDRNLGPFLAEMTRVTNMQDDANWRGQDEIVDERAEYAALRDSLWPLRNDWSEPVTASRRVATHRDWPTLYGSTIT